MKFEDGMRAWSKCGFEGGVRLEIGFEGRMRPSPEGARCNVSVSRQSCERPFAGPRGAVAKDGANRRQ
eukprot:scaffold45543_cov20-Tisochrysis_lutea.AAC.3